MKKTIFSILVIALLFLTACGGKTASTYPEDDGRNEEISAGEAEGMLPERCTLPSAVACVDFSYGSDILSLKLTGLGMGDIEDLKITAVECGNAEFTLDSFPFGEEIIAKFDCSSHNGDVLITDMLVSYVELSNPSGPEVVQKSGKVKIKK